MDGSFTLFDMTQLLRNKKELSGIIVCRIKVSKALYDERKATSKWLIRRQSLCGSNRFRETHKVMRQHSDPMIGGLVCDI